MRRMSGGWNVWRRMAGMGVLWCDPRPKKQEENRPQETEIRT
jgi:hypothetical protein